MTDTHNRYPGAQPFSDNEFSRRTFFGREHASIALTDQVLANRLVVVYAKSGIGKSSLLNAGVAPRLREAANLPLFVRVNDVRRTPLVSVVERIREEAERQGVEYVPGEGSSLWSFFKTAEFWRGDLLLTPVLIIDQFEELFTLHDDAAREEFLADLGYLIRGVPPATAPQPEPGVSISPPLVHVVLSLREDFLGILEEAADHIPQILDHRFRLTPLSCETAAQAITGPAAIDVPDLATKPFRLDPEFVTVVLNYLTRTTAGVRASGGGHVEPFHLQLICRRIEKVAALQQTISSAEVVVNFKNFGGEAALAQTLVNFYKEAVQSVPDRYLRPAVRRLCEEFLISPEGRRLSMEERELQRQLRLPHTTLQLLVENRLLRTDRRSDSIYYELSHDTLVEPVLASRRTRALIVGWVALLAGSIICLLAAGLILLLLLAVFVEKQHESSRSVLYLVMVVTLASFGSLGFRWARNGLRRRARYRRHTPAEFAEQLPTLQPLRVRLLGWTLAGAGFTLLAAWGFVTLFMVVIFTILFSTHGTFPKGAEWQSMWPLLQRRPWIETTWILFQLAGTMLFSWILLQLGLRKLEPNSGARRTKGLLVPGVDSPNSWLPTFLKVLLGTAALILAAFCSYILVHCVRVSDASPPNWAPEHISVVCRAIRENGWRKLDFESVMFVLSPLILSFAFLRTGVREAWSLLRHRRLMHAKVVN